jgi:hypothetical protein
VTLAADRDLRRPKTPYVRFSTYHPINNVEGFSLNLLLRRVPIPTWPSLFSAANTGHSYFVECQLRGLLTEATLETVMQEYATENLSPPGAAAVLKQRFLAQHAFDADTTAIPPSTVEEVAQQHIADMHPDLEDIPDHRLTAEQQAVVNAILAGQRGIFVVSGCGGSGKTHVAKVCSTTPLPLPYFA